jgi:release factor glutamine methyltransferase
MSRVRRAAHRPDVAATTARLRAAGCVFAEDEAWLLHEAADGEALAELVERRVAGEPVEHILGWAEFAGLRIVVEPGVFVPRRRSELLVRQATAAGRPGAVVVDLGCGSGAIGTAIVTALDGAELHATDIDPVAVRCARRNVAAVQGQVYEGDLDESLPQRLRGRVDVLVTNAPYVPTNALGTMPPEARLHEPRVALDGGADGLDVVRRVVDVAPEWLAPGGSLLVETGRRQTAVVTRRVAAVGLSPRVVKSDHLYATVVIGSMPSP